MAGFKEHPENINYNGRPKKGETLSDILRSKLNKDVFVDKLIKLAESGSMPAIKEIYERIEGKVAEKQRFVDEEDKDININVNIKEIE